MVSLFIIYTTHTTASVSLWSNETSCLFILWIVEIIAQKYAALCKSSIYISDDLNGLMIFKGYLHWVNYYSEMCCTLQIFHLYNRSFKWFDDFYGLVERMQFNFCHVTNKCHENFSLTLLLMGGGVGLYQLFWKGAPAVSLLIFETQKPNFTLAFLLTFMPPPH